MSKHCIELECERDGDTVLVTWFYIYDGGDSSVPVTVEVELDWQPEEYDVGINAGYNVHGDVPDDVAYAISEKYSDSHDWDD